MKIIYTMNNIDKMIRQQVLMVNLEDLAHLEEENHYGPFSSVDRKTIK